MVWDAVQVRVGASLTAEKSLTFPRTRARDYGAPSADSRRDVLFRRAHIFTFYSNFFFKQQVLDHLKRWCHFERNLTITKADVFWKTLSDKCPRWKSNKAKVYHNRMVELLSPSYHRPKILTALRIVEATCLHIVYGCHPILRSFHASYSVHLYGTTARMGPHNAYNYHDDGC